MEWTAFPVGIVIATLATMVGIGGGILWTPFLIFVVRLDPSQAVLTSLLIQIAGMGSGGAVALIRKKVNIKFAAFTAAAASPGVAVGVALKGVVNPDSLVFLLGAACMATALVFVTAREEFEFIPTGEVSFRAAAPYAWLPPALSILTGLLSIGIGDFLVPILRNRLGMKMDAAIGCCLIVMSFNAALASTLYILGGQSFPGTYVCWAMAGVVIGGQLGPRVAAKIPDQTLKEIFIYGLSLVGVHVLFNA